MKIAHVHEKFTSRSQCRSIKINTSITTFRLPFIVCRASLAYGRAADRCRHLGRVLDDQKYFEVTPKSTCIDEILHAELMVLKVVVGEASGFAPIRVYSYDSYIRILYISISFYAGFIP